MEADEFASRPIPPPPEGSRPWAAETVRSDRRKLDPLRAAAALIDLAVAGIPAYLLARSVIFDHEVAMWGLTIGFVLTYFFLCESVNGQTLGKRIVGLRAMTTDYRPADARAIGARTVLRLVDLSLIGLIVYYASGSRRQRIGDFAGRTIVAPASECRGPHPGYSQWHLLYPLLWIGAAMAVVVVGFQSDSELRRADFEAGIRQSGAVLAVPQPMVECMVASTRRTISDSQLKQLASSNLDVARFGFAALPIGLRAEALHTSFHCAKQLGAFDGPNAAATEDAVRGYYGCIALHTTAYGIDACRRQYLKP